MGSSWNFPARASPSCEVAEPSWGSLIFKLKNEVEQLKVEKESLLAEVSRRGFEDLTDKMRLAINKENSKSAKDRFLEMGLAYLEFGLEKRKTYDLMHSPIIDKVEFPELLNAAQGAFDELVQVLTELFPGISEDDLGKKCIKSAYLKHFSKIHI